MKKLVLTAIALVAGATLGYSQGNIILVNSVSTFYISTNGTSIGLGTGVAYGPSTSYYYEVLDSTVVVASTGNQLLFNLANQALWQDSGVSGDSNNSLKKGGIADSPNPVSAAHWGAPTGNDYTTGPTDYYIVVGWSANLGTTWAIAEANLNNNSWQSLSTTPWFGTSAVAYQEAGGGTDALPAVSVWGSPAQSGLAGAGLTTGFQLLPVPEPSTMVLAGLGGLSLLLFRRRK
ncbi:MAG: PEP-CTERM sorting domain-containing protein [Verrucomicrobiota bacterium]|jgi:hypothetical protein